MPKKYLCKPCAGLRQWAGALLALVALAALGCGVLLEGQQALAAHLVRLHVVANSDEAGDQALKLLVRDEVLARAQPYLAQARSAGEARGILAEHLEELARAGERVVGEQGYDYSVTVTLGTAHFPTKYYQGFALPAGEYQALRVVIGAGEGRNWWCVVFPSLCVTAAGQWQDVAVSGGLTQEEVALLEGEQPGYVLRFKCLELLDRLIQWGA